MEGLEFLDHLRSYELLKNFVPWSLLLSVVEDTASNFCKITVSVVILVNISLLT
jgi:hypothetical protein